MSKEAMFILSIATEEFVKRLAEAGRRQANAARRSTINYRDVASATHQYPEFNFLRETIPEPISLAQALALREAKAKEIIETNPATSVHKPSPVVTTPIPSIATLRPSPPATTISETSSTAPSRAKGKARQSNSSKTNGTTTGTGPGAGTGGTKRTRERKARQDAALAESQNGVVTAQDEQHQNHHHLKQASGKGREGAGGVASADGRRRSSRATRDAGGVSAMPPPLSTTTTTASSPTRLNGLQPHQSSPNGLGLQDARPPEHSSTPPTGSSHLHTHSSPRNRGVESTPWPSPFAEPHAAPPPYSPNYPDHLPPHHALTNLIPSPHSPPPHPENGLWGPATAHRPHFTGPASGYLEDHRLLFDGRGGGITGNPGRTIYSQQRAPNR